MKKETEVILSKGGTAEKTVSISQIAIPDMWHIAETIRKRCSIANPEATADQILKCWHLAHSLHRHISKPNSPPPAQVQSWSGL